MKKQTNVIVALVLALILCVFSFGIFHSQWGESTFVIPVEFSHGSGDTESLTRTSQIPKDKHVILFPHLFHLKRREDLVDYYVGPLNGKLKLKDEDYYIARYRKPKVSNKIHQQLQSYSEHKFSVFDTSETILGKLGMCDKLKSQLSVQVSGQTPLEVPISDVVRRLYESSYYEEVEPLFKEKPIEEQLKDESFGKYWFHFAGSSVYLKEYGVHFMVSRVVFSKDQARQRATVSLLYGDIYDEEWNLMPNIELVVPSNTAFFGGIPGVALQDTTPYALFEAPNFIRVPVYHKAKLVDRDFYGPEDPRVLLVRNPRGYDEPVIVFNQNHRILESSDDVEIEKVSVSLKRYRSMFQCFPWQFSRGRGSVDELPSSEEIEQDASKGNPLSERVYHRTVELRITNYRRPGTQKNWSPFISHADRKKFGYDRYIYYVYRWKDMDVLRCHLYDTIEHSASTCDFVYRREAQQWISDGPGPFRGGTNLININVLLEENRHRFPVLGEIQDNLELADREVWVGFARAHVSNCGCDGGSFYRPNFVVLTREANDQFRASLASGFTAYKIDVPAWDLNKPDDQCLNGPSVLIPNSILKWEIQGVQTTQDTTEIDDILTFHFSVADARTRVMYIRGLLGAIVTLDEESDEGGKRIFGAPQSDPRTYTNDNIDCAVQRSYDYCRAYGKTFAEPKPDENGSIDTQDLIPEHFEEI